MTDLPLTEIRCGRCHGLVAFRRGFGQATEGVLCIPCAECLRLYFALDTATG